MTVVVKRRLSTALLLVTMGLGLWFSGQGLWIHAKALLAQVLLEQAWAETLAQAPVETQADAEPVRPWPWADTWPVARLTVGQGASKRARQDAGQPEVDLIVLAGDSGRTLAFGPGHSSGSAAPGEPGTTIISGHRDTHFRFLEQLKPGHELTLTGADGATAYRVEQVRVVDSRRVRLTDSGDGKRLVLVTCWPFDTMAPGGPLRYVIEAEPVAPVTTVDGPTI